MAVIKTKYRSRINPEVNAGDNFTILSKIRLTSENEQAHTSH